MFRLPDGRIRQQTKALADIVLRLGESTVHNPALISGETSPKSIAIAYWIVTALFCLEMMFTAYYELWVLPQAAQAFTRLGFPAGYFRAELSWAKVVGVLALLIPMVPARLKEWAYAGFAINLVSAVIAHSSIHDRPAAFAPSSITSVLWILSYYFWRRLQLTTSS
jgi:DoxX-like protein